MFSCTMYVKNRKYPRDKIVILHDCFQTDLNAELFLTYIF